MAAAAAAEPDSYEDYAKVVAEAKIEQHQHWYGMHLVDVTKGVISDVLPPWLAGEVASPLGATAADALALCGLLARVCTSWRDAVREALGGTLARLAPALLGLGARDPWAALQRSAWTLQLRLVVRRVRLVQSWSGVQDLRGLCTLVLPGDELAPQHTRCEVTTINYCVWRLSRGAVLRWFAQLFEFVAVGLVASLSSAEADGRIRVKEMVDTRARMRNVATLAADHLQLQSFEAAAHDFPSAHYDRFSSFSPDEPAQHGYRGEIDGLRTHLTRLALNAWQRVALDATLPLRGARTPAALLRQVGPQHTDLLQLHLSLAAAARSDTDADTAPSEEEEDDIVAWLDAAARARLREAIRKVLRLAWTNREEPLDGATAAGAFSKEQPEPEQEQTELLDDALLLEIAGKQWLEISASRASSTASASMVDKLRRRFRDPSAFACAKLWELLSSRSLFSADDDEVTAVRGLLQKHDRRGSSRSRGSSSSSNGRSAAAVAAPRNVPVAPQGLRLDGRALLGARWPECSSAKAPPVLTPARDILHLQQALPVPPVTNVGGGGGTAAGHRAGAAGSDGNGIDMKSLLSTPELHRSRAVRALTRDLQRVWRQAAELHNQKLPVVVAEPAAVGGGPEADGGEGGIDLSCWRGMLYGPEGTAWEGGRFEFELRIQIDTYPTSPPIMRFLPVLLPPPPDSRDGGERGERERTCCVFHPNVDERGFVCADVLATEWSSVCSVSTLLLSVQSILDDPSCERPANVQAAALLLQDRTRYLQRVRMLARATSKARDWDPNT